jgi:serine phosphatase RsbU (regulator of sigma subunit)/Tfp pilus assembly protein PilF
VAAKIVCPIRKPHIRMIKIKYFLFALILCFYQFNSLAQKNKTDSLFLVLKTTQNDTTRINTLNTLAWELKSNNPDTAILLSTSALELAQKNKWQKGEGNSCQKLGVFNWLKSNYAVALDYYFKALKIRESIDDKIGISKTVGNIGIIYYNQGNYPKALEYYFKALKMDEELGDKNGIKADFENIGLVYDNQGDYSKSLDYHFKALKLNNEMGDKYGVANSLGNMAIIYNEQKDYPKALEYYFKALKIGEELGDENLIYKQLGNIGILYFGQKDYHTALYYHFKVVKIAEELEDKNGIAAMMSNIGFIYIYFKKYKLAEDYLLKALVLSEKIKALDQASLIELHLTDLYTQTNQPAKAFEHYKKYIAAKDSIFNEENTKKIVRSEMNFNFQKKEAMATAEQEKKDAIALQEKQKQRVITYAISMGLFLVLLLAVFIFRGYKQKQKANFLLTDKNKIIEEKNKEITDSINYAKRIQQAKLPKKEEIYAHLSQSFILFKPKDIVSGDFYFFHSSQQPTTNNQQLFIAAADCTGHGVPGAFMSMIGSEKLNDAVLQSSDTSEILKLLNKGIKTSLHQSESQDSTRDGMDIALCSIDLENNTVRYAGANRPLWIIRKMENGKLTIDNETSQQPTTNNQQLIEIKATKKAIGGFTEDNQHFDTHEINVSKGDTLYIFTDGYADQFGGEGRKKFMTKRFKDTLLEIQNKTMQEQEQHLDNVIENWKAGIEQIDDILVIGIRI